VRVADLPIQLSTALADRYTLERPLGRGGMATVYLARDLRHRRPVALKVLHPELAFALGAERFLREIEMAANLSHPHILPLFDSGEVGGLLYYVMPYVDGESLRDRLRRETQLPVDSTLQIAREVADALAYAHRQGVIHRDIKPENILLSGGHALVADFGVARAVDQPGVERLTDTGLAVGTAAYMSPEQASGASQLDGRSDIFSLGCVVYEMLAGEPPFTGPTVYAIIAQRFNDKVPSVRVLRSAVTPEMDQAVGRALAPVPADRFATATEFARALQPTVSMATPSPTLGPRRFWRTGVRVSRRLQVAATALGVAAVIGLGALFGSHPSRKVGAAPVGPKVLAVLPFENLGDSADAYFADGVTDALRTKLSQIGGLAVIARSSSNEYRQTTKPAQQIARELGVDYLLTATVRWERGSTGDSRVRVTPELVEVDPGHAPRTRWGEQFDAAMTGVFQVQADIAGRVAEALGVALGDSTRRELAAKPTQSLPAYDAFLRGEAASQRMSTLDPARLRRAVSAYEQAVALDSTFVEAWARLSAAHATLYYGVSPTPAGAEAARHAAERARSLAPNRPETHQALGLYYYNVLSDHERSFTEDSIALALAPGNTELLGALGWDELSLGRWQEATTHFEQAARLDPRSAMAAGNLGFVLLSTRRFPEAERAYDRALEFAPENLSWREFRVMVALAQGDLRGARAVLRAAPKEVDPTSLVAYMSWYGDLMWVLDESQQQLLLRLTPSAFDNDRGSWASVRAQTYALRGNAAKTRVYADSALVTLKHQLLSSPDNAQRHALAGLAYAYLGRRADAIREGRRAVELLPVSRAAADGAYIQHQLVRIYVLVDEHEQALDQLEPLLRIPYILSPGWLRIDPAFDPLRGNPRFERLAEGRTADG
jgi:serine/threonine-protein kinase